MVNNQMIKLFIYILIILSSNFTASFSLASNSKLMLFIDKTESMLGRPIRAELYAISLNEKITNINLAALSKDFGVITDYSINDTTDKRWPQQSIQILKLKLYPRYTGKITIPSIISNKIRTKQKTISITQGNTGIPKISISSKKPYERQQFIVNISLTSKESTSRLSIKNSLKIKGFESTPLEFIRIKEKDGTYINKIGWAITALKSGKLNLKLPPVEYSVSGVSRKQFYFPKTTILISPTPTYLSPTITVGKVTIDSETPDSLFLQSNSISYWNIKVSSNVNNTYRLPSIVRQIKSNSSIKFFPAIIKRSTSITENQITSTSNYSIPFKTLHTGSIELPDLRIQYFEPGTGIIELITIHPKSIVSLNIFWKNFIYIIIFSLLAYLLFIAYKMMTKIKESNHFRNNALKLLSNIRSSDDIRKSIRLLAKAECWPHNITISQWGDLWRQEFITDDNFNTILISLSSYLYASEKENKLYKMNLQLIELVKKRKKL